VNIYEDRDLYKFQTAQQSSELQFSLNREEVAAVSNLHFLLKEVCKVLELFSFIMRKDVRLIVCALPGFREQMTRLTVANVLRSKALQSLVRELLMLIFKQAKPGI